MSGLKRRLERLEEQYGPPGEATREAEDKRLWLARAQARCIEDQGDWHTADTIRLLRMQGRLGTTTEDLRERLLTWKPPLDTSTVERELARTIYLREPGTENMVCPAPWRDSFVAADELRERYASVPDETLAKWGLWQHELERGVDEENLVERITCEADAHGITEGLMFKAIGPDAEELEEGEASRRLREILSDLYYGERGYEIQKHINRLTNERANR